MFYKVQAMAFDPLRTVPVSENTKLLVDTFRSVLGLQGDLFVFIDKAFAQ